MERNAKASAKKDAFEDIYDQFYDLQSVVSAQGMTGLTPELPQSEEQLDAYSRLQGIPKKP